jgi:hypothetical protein
MQPSALPCECNMEAPHEQVTGADSIVDGLRRWHASAPDDALLLSWRAIVAPAARVKAPTAYIAPGFTIVDGRAVPFEGPTLPYESGADLIYSGFPDRGYAFRAVGGALRFERDAGDAYADRDDAARAGAPAVGGLLELVPSRRRAGSRKRHGTAALRAALYVKGLMLAGMTHDAALRDWIGLTGDQLGRDALARADWHDYERAMAAAHRRTWRALGIASLRAPDGINASRVETVVAAASGADLDVLHNGPNRRASLIEP